MLTTLPDLVLAKIAQYLPLFSAVDVAQACRRLRLAFPRALSEAFCEALGESPIRHSARVTHESQLAYLLEWMRVYDLTLVVRSKDIVRIIGWLAGWPMARWARLDLTRCCDYVAIYRHMRRQGLIEHIVRMPKPSYIPLRFRRGNAAPRVVEEHEEDSDDLYDSDPDGVEYDRMSRANAVCKVGRRVIDALAPHLGNVHTLNLTLNTTDAQIAHLIRLHTLFLRDAAVTDAGVALLSGLHTLDLQGTRVGDAGVAHLSKLNTLFLGNTDVTDAGVACLSGLHTLELRYTRVGDVGVAHLSGLHTLGLRGTRVTDTGVAYLSGLHTLDLTQTRVTDAGVARLSGLCALDLQGTRVTDAGFEYLRLHNVRCDNVSRTLTPYELRLLTSLCR